MVEGVSRQVVVARAPDSRFFEQVIFILKENIFGRGVTVDDVLQGAHQVANGYTRRNSRWGRLWWHIPTPAYVAAGVLGATACRRVALVL